MPEIQDKKELAASFKLPLQLNQKMNERIIADGYGMMGKSRWIIEAVDSFLGLKNHIELTGLSDEIEKNNKAISLRVPRSLMLAIEKGIEEIRKELPLLEGVKSKIFRASIYQRVLNNYKKAGDRSFVYVVEK